MSQDIARNTMFFDLWARRKGYPHFQNSEYREVLQGCTELLGGGRRVLDVGAGVGLVAAQVKAFGNHVVGLDLSASALNTALTEKRIDEAVVGDVLSANLENRDIDVVLCWGVLMLIFDLPAVFRRLHTVLKPGGTILFFDHHARNPYTKLHFSRPDWVDRFLEGQSNMPRHAFREQEIYEASQDLFDWEQPRFHSMFTSHPHPLIHSAHLGAKIAFGAVRCITRAPWTANFLSLTGKKLRT